MVSLPVALGGKACAARASALQIDNITAKVFYLALLVNSSCFEGHEKATKGQVRQ